MNTTQTTCDELAAALYLARQRKKRARIAFSNACAELGKCDAANHGIEPCYYDMTDPCDVCKAKQPIYEEMVAAGQAAGVALRRVLNAGKRIVREREAIAD